MVDILAPHITDPCYFSQNMSFDDIEELADWNFGKLFWLTRTTANENAPVSDENTPESDENAPESDDQTTESDENAPESEEGEPKCEIQTLELAKEMAE